MSIYMFMYTIDEDNKYNITIYMTRCGDCVISLTYKNTRKQEITMYLSQCMPLWHNVIWTSYSQAIYNI